MSIDTAAPTAPEQPTRRRPSSGTVFVIACATFAVAFVLFIVFVSPILLDRTLALAPPPAPQVVASGELDGSTWSVEAYDATAGLRVPDADGIEPVLDPEPCARLDFGDGTAVHELCVERRGSSIRDLVAVPHESGRAIVIGIVAPQVTEVVLRPAEGDALLAVPSYVDFGFPLGFVVAEVDAATPYVGASALNRDGVERARAVCETDPLPFGECVVTEGEY